MPPRANGPFWEAGLDAQKLLRRVEIAFPVEEEKQEAQILQMLDDYMADNKYATELKGTGRY